MIDRNRQLRWAAYASVVSKCGTFLLQIVVVPIAIRRLGPERFGVYATVVSVFSFLSLADFGFGPGIVRAVATARAREAFREAKETIGVAIVGIGCALAMIGALLLGLVWFLPVQLLLGSGFEPFQQDVRLAATVGILLVAFQMVASVFGRAQAGCQEMHISNLVGAVGSVLGALSVLFIVVVDHVTVVSLLVAVVGSATMAAQGNVLLFLVRHPEFRPTFLMPTPGRFRSFFVDSFGFWLAGSLVPLLQREGGRLLLAQINGPLEVGRLGVLQQAGTYVAGLVVIYTGPLFAAIADAWGKRDVGWVESARMRSHILWAAVSFSMVTCGFIFGPDLLKLWVGKEFSITRGEMLSYTVFMTLVLWSHIHFVILGSTGKSTVVARVMLLEAFLGLSMSAIVIPWLGVAGMFAAMSVAAVLTSAWILPRFASKQISQLREKSVV